jgi:hypothetical protein
MNQRGQILIPGLAITLTLVLLTLGYIGWASRALWQMRMDSAADAAALSAARAQAEMLNTLSVSNMGVNLFVLKADIPLIHNAVGVMKEESIANFEAWNWMMQKQLWGFKTFPAGVGMQVARLNGAKGMSLYWPAPMDHYLQAQAIHVGILLSHPPLAGYRFWEKAYYARGWEPGRANAQPPHKTTWLVRRGSVRAVASARLWLDVNGASPWSNGGFPRPREHWLRGALIQGLYPQFNARLLAAPAISMERFMALQTQRRTS